MTDRAWTCEQITDTAERTLREHLEFLRRCRADLTACEWSRKRRQVANWAQGTLLLWTDLTQEWANHGDEARLRALVESIQSEPYEVAMPGESVR